MNSLINISVFFALLISPIELALGETVKDVLPTPGFSLEKLAHFKESLKDKDCYADDQMFGGPCDQERRRRIKAEAECNCLVLKNLDDRVIRGTVRFEDYKMGFLDGCIRERLLILQDRNFC